MAIPTSRTKETAGIIIDANRCNGCGLCVSVCKDFGLIIENEKVKRSAKPIFGCTGCGHCMMACPHEAIRIEGRCTSAEYLSELPEQTQISNYKSLVALLNKRRSIREFKDMPIEKSLIEKVLSAARAAPMGIPPSDVHVLVLDTREKVIDFAKDFCQYLDNVKWVTSRWFTTIMRPFWGKDRHEMMTGFVKSLTNTYTSFMKTGLNVVTYDAPVALYFYGSPFTDPADPVIAATYAMIAAESLGLGTCMLGAIHPFIQHGKAGKKFRLKHGIKFKSREGLWLVMGYPQIKYHKSIKRTFASEDWS